MSDAVSGAVHAVGVAGLLRRTPAVDPQVLEQAQQSALAEAYAQGVQDGEAAMRSTFASQTAQADALHAARHEATLGASAAVQQALGEAFAEGLCDLAMAVARVVIAAEPGVRPETLGSLLDEVLSAAAAGAGGAVFVAEDALEAASAVLPAGWTLAVDAMLLPGTVRAVVDGSVFTASLERRVAQLATRLAGES